MIKNGRYAYYKGNEFKFSKDADGNYIIITSDSQKIDDTFQDKYNTGVFSKIIDLSDLDEIYRIETYGKVNEERVSIIKEKHGEYLVGTSDCKIGEKLNLERVDKYGYEGWLSSNLVQIIEEKTSYKIMDARATPLRVQYHQKI